MPLPQDYWRNYEREIRSLGVFVEVASALSQAWPHRRFVWRGVADSRYALHSSLYRGIRRHGRTTEHQLRIAEDMIIAEARAWWLQRTASDRLSALELLAALQHQGVPTRLLDFSHNAMVGMWFAVEQKYDEYGRPRAETDGRVFVAQANGREISAEWERDAELPWRSAPTDWSRDIFIWTPPPIDPRMTRQQGCFVFGGVPTTAGGWNLSPRGAGLLGQAGVRACVSIPIRLNSPGYLTSSVQPGRPPGYPLAFTLRIPAASKPSVRRDLERAFGYSHAMMYPDYPGFAAFGRSIPKPPAP